MEKTAFHRELEALLNRHSQENASNTPDFVLAEFLTGCLATFNTCVNQREGWYGRQPTGLGQQQQAEA